MIPYVFAIVMLEGENYCYILCHRVQFLLEPTPRTRVQGLSYSQKRVQSANTQHQGFNVNQHLVPMGYKVSPLKTNIPHEYGRIACNVNAPPF